MSWTLQSVRLLLFPLLDALSSRLDARCLLLCTAPLTTVLGGNSYNPLGAWMWECAGAQYVLLRMWMLCPNQASSLQGCHGVNCAILAVKNWGIGSGWQQSKQNSVLLAVVGQWS